MATEERRLPTLVRPPRSRASRVGVALGVTAAALAGLAVANVYATRRAERRNPPRGRFITVDGVRVHYLEGGEGPPVVLIHGNVATAEDFVVSGLFDRLTKHHRVIAFDRPGMGYTERPRGILWTPAEQATLLRHAFGELGVERPVVLGHSLGAMIAVALALDHSQAVSGIVLLSGYYFPTVRLDVVLAAPPAIPVLGDVLRYTLSPPFGAAIMPALLKSIFAPRPVPEHFRERFPVSLAIRPGQIRAESEDGVMMIPGAGAMQDRYRELTMPVAILAGADDHIVRAEEQSVVLHQLIPQSTLERLPGVGHMVHYAAPNLVVDMIDRVGAMAGARA